MSQTNLNSQVTRNSPIVSIFFLIKFIIRATKLTFFFFNFFPCPFEPEGGVANEQLKIQKEKEGEVLLRPGVITGW